ncbi:MAG TPA: alcohol dehydrogenase catalytic domain-containing protein [Kofleriaceae bacterium]
MTPAADDVVIDVEGIQGTAAIGRVIEAGDRAAGLVDRRVLVGGSDPCGECEVCRRGGAPVCPTARHRSSIGRRVIAAARWVIPLGDGLELPVPAGAAAAGDVALAYTIYARTGLAARDPVVIVGATPVTRFLVEILVAKGVTPTVVLDPALAAFAAWAAARGATVTVPDQLAAAMAAQGLGTRPYKILAVADFALAAGLAGPRATLTIASGSPAELPGALIANEVTVIGVVAAHPDLVVEAAAMCARGEIDLAGGTSTTPDASLLQARLELPT